ncbi:MAG: hypothetical protein PVSMB9_07000 [Candidatus Dormibacteria bacterium]
MSRATGRGPNQEPATEGGRRRARLFLFAAAKARGSRGRGSLPGILLLALLAAAAYTAFTGFALYNQIDSGRRELVAAQAGLAAAASSADGSSLATTAAELRRAEQDFADAERRARKDPALELLGRIAPAGRQLDATARLAAIGLEVSRAGESAATIAVEVDRLKLQYAGKALTPESLPSLLQQAQAIATKYRVSTGAIGDELRAAHAERAAVDPGQLIAPLQEAYHQVDVALAAADTAFGGYRDVRRLLSDLLGVALP